MQYPKKLSPEFSGALSTFSFWIANGTVGYPLLEGVDYLACLGEEPSMLEITYAIFANVLEFNEQGVPVNAKYAQFRAAQYIRQYCQPGYQPVPAFEAWEQELFGPPDRQDSKPWPPGAA